MSLVNFGSSQFREVGLRLCVASLPSKFFVDQDYESTLRLIQMWLVRASREQQRNLQYFDQYVTKEKLSAILRHRRVLAGGDVRFTATFMKHPLSGASLNINLLGPEDRLQ